MDEPRSGPLSKPRHGQGVHHQVVGHALLQGPAHDLAVKQIEHAGKIEPALARPQWSERPGVVELSPGLPNRTCSRLAHPALHSFKCCVRRNAPVAVLTTPEKREGRSALGQPYKMPSAKST